MRTQCLPALTAGITAAIFIFDTITDYEIAFATFYIIVVLLSLYFCRGRGVVAVSAGCVLLTLVSYCLTSEGEFRPGIINLAISLLAIGATTFLALKIEAARTIATEAQVQLARVARVTTLGELMASIAHEINQPLTAIATNANACERWLGAEPPNFERAMASIHSIATDAGRASDIIFRIRAQVTQSVPRKEWNDINEIVQDSLVLIRRQIEEQHVALKITPAKNLPLVFSDKIQLGQVLINLLVNAIESMSAVDNSRRIIHIATRLTDEDEIELSVEDSGEGLPPAIGDHLFDAFRTTKVGGMGIGLAICRTIVEGHGGRIWAEPGSLPGARFKFVLPAEGHER